MSHRPRFVETTRDQASATRPTRPREPVLLLAFHPDLRRVGEWTRLEARVTELSRLTPTFRSPSGVETAPLDDPFLRRHPFELRRLPRGALELENPHDIAVTVDGVPLVAGAPLRLSAEQLAQGVALVIAERVILLLLADVVYEAEDLGLRGCSAQLAALRAAVREAASSGGPILILGETGAGKELVARALHAAGPRAAGPFLAVNVAAIPPSVAAAELFGHERGAFTGADGARPGYFARAAGGVLFLDEIADLPADAQPILLRALETGEVQPVGGLPRRIELTVVAATDAALDDATAAHGFRRPLFYRLAARTLRVPPLRERIADLPVLLAHFVIAELAQDDAQLLDQTTSDTPRLPAAAVAALLLKRWPGNVRELRHAARHLAACMRTGATIDPRALGGDAPPRAEASRAPAPDEPPRTTAYPIEEERLLATLRHHRFQLNQTAHALGISRSHLDALIARSARVRKAKDLTREELEACRQLVGDDLDAMAAALEVSVRGLRLRLSQLGM